MTFLCMRRGNCLFLPCHWLRSGSEKKSMPTNHQPKVSSSSPFDVRWENLPGNSNSISIVHASLLPSCDWMENGKLQWTHTTTNVYDIPTRPYFYCSMFVFDDSGIIIQESRVDAPHIRGNVWKWLICNTFEKRNVSRFCINAKNTSPQQLRYESKQFQQTSTSWDAYFGNCFNVICFKRGKRKCENKKRQQRQGLRPNDEQVINTWSARARVLVEGQRTTAIHARLLYDNQMSERTICIIVLPHRSNSYFIEIDW